MNCKQTNFFKRFFLQKYGACNRTRLYIPGQFTNVCWTRTFVDARLLRQHVALELFSVNILPCNIAFIVVQFTLNENQFAGTNFIISNNIFAPNSHWSCEEKLSFRRSVLNNLTEICYKNMLLWSYLEQVRQV